MDARDLVKVLGSWSTGRGPLYRQLARAVGDAIVRGDVMAGALLPPERTLAGALALSRSTVVSAYELLREEELVESRQGSGTRVRGDVDVPALPRRELLPRLAARTSLLDMTMPGPVEVIDLSRGSPYIPSGLDAEDFTLSADETMRLLKGPVYMAQGSSALRRAIAERYTRAGLPTNEAQILITSGAQQAIALLAALYVQRGDSVVIENPTYVGAIDAFRSAGARLIPVGVEREGLRVEMLRGVVGSTFPQLIYLVPTFQNPTGTTLSEAQRIELARMAAQLAVPLVADDTLADIELERAAPPTLATYAVGGTILTIGSLSKLFWGGLRIGWIRGPEAVITRLTRVRVMSDLGSTPLTQAIAARLMPRVEEVKAMRRAEMVPRLDILCALLGELLPSWEWKRPDGGIFLWVKLPSGDAREFAQVALRYGVLITSGTALSVDEGHSEYIRLAFLLDPTSLRSGIERLARAWASYAAEPAEHLVSVMV